MQSAKQKSAAEQKSAETFKLQNLQKYADYRYLYKCADCRNVETIEIQRNIQTAETNLQNKNP